MYINKCHRTDDSLIITLYRSTTFTQSLGARFVSEFGIFKFYICNVQVFLNQPLCFTKISAVIKGYKYC